MPMNINEYRLRWDTYYFVIQQPIEKEGIFTLWFQATLFVKWALESAHANQSQLIYYQVSL